MRIVVTHANTDLDALASMICARRLYDGATCVLGKNLSRPVKRYLALHKDAAGLANISDIDPESVEEIIVVDVRDGRRLRDYAAFFEHAKRVVVYDHHPAGAHDIDADETHIEPVGACATLLCERIRAANLPITPWEATLALLGIYADTGKLSFDGTTPRDLDIAAYLLRRRASLSVVNRYMQQRFSPEQVQLLTQMVRAQEELSVDGVEIVLSVGRSEEIVRSAASVVEDIMRLGAHDAVFGLIEFNRGKRVQLIGRSRVPYIDVGAILRALGGGGHPGAAAASFKDREVESVMEELKEVVRAEKFAPVRVADVMSSPVQPIDRDITLAEAKELLERWNYSGAPVRAAGLQPGSSPCDGKNLEGIISRRDIERAEAAGNLDLPVASHMSHEVVTISEDEPIEDALEIMTRKDVGRLPVYSGERLVGILTRSDVLRRIYE